MTSNSTKIPGFVNAVAISDSGLAEDDFLQAETLLFHQTIVFYMDAISAIQELLQGYESINILDVGSRTGAGANLLGYVFSGNSYSRIKASVTALDIDDKFKQYALAKFPWIDDYLIDDVANLNDSWDVVICSHTIEHVPDYSRFIETLRSRAAKYLIIMAPYDEANCKLIKDIPMCEGHLNSVTHAAITAFSPVVFKIYRSLVWHQSLAFIAVISGEAKN